jgi:hypothetical protein
MARQSAAEDRAESQSETDAALDDQAAAIIKNIDFAAIIKSADSMKLQAAISCLAATISWAAAETGRPDFEILSELRESGLDLGRHKGHHSTA